MAQWQEVGRYGAYDQLFQHEAGWVARLSLTPEGDLLARLGHAQTPDITHDEVRMNQAQAHEWPTFFELATAHFNQFIGSSAGQAVLEKLDCGD